MDVGEFRIKGKEMVDFICKYMEDLPGKKVTHSVEPGYIRKFLSEDAPNDPEDCNAIMNDVEHVIMKGITHWLHPGFHGYFPHSSSYPSIMGDMLSNAIGAVGFSWYSCPAMTELEVVVLDWLAKAMHLPDCLTSSGKRSIGGAVLQPSIADSIVISMMAARFRSVMMLKGTEQNICPGNKSCKDQTTYVKYLVAYCSDEGYSCLLKAARICLIQLRILSTDENCTLRAAVLKEAIEEDISRGLTPFYLCVTLGTPNTCSLDNMQEIIEITVNYPNIWVHVNAPYVGNSFICPEFEHLTQHFKDIDSLSVDLHNWLQIDFDCSCMFIREKQALLDAMAVSAEYLKHPDENVSIDFRNWGISLSRRFRALKIWFTLRAFGLKRLRRIIINHCQLAKYLEEKIKKDGRFEIMNNVQFGLVCFAFRKSENVTDRNELTKELLENANNTGKIYLSPAEVKGRYIIRFFISYVDSTSDDIDRSWSVIEEEANKIKKDQDSCQTVDCERMKTSNCSDLTSQEDSG